MSIRIWNDWLPKIPKEVLINPLNMINSVESGTGSGVDLKKTRRTKSVLADPMKVDRLPPHSTEAEQGVLGCVLLSPNDSMGECIQKFKAGSEVFYDLKHRTIYEALVEMYDAKEAIDSITVQQRLRDRQQLEAVGGLAYLSSLPDSVPSAANLPYYLDIVRAEVPPPEDHSDLHRGGRPGL